MNIIELNQILSAIAPELKSRFGLTSMAYFGSWARNEQTDESDVDILIDYNESLGWKFFDLKEYLENALQKKVDLVTRPALRKEWVPEIEAQLKYILL